MRRNDGDPCVVANGEIGYTVSRSSAQGMPVTHAKRDIQARLIRRDSDDGSFDRAFWRRLGHEARFAAAWEMVVEATLFRGEDAGESGLQRSVCHIQRRER